MEPFFIDSTYAVDALAGGLEGLQPSKKSFIFRLAAAALPPQLAGKERSWGGKPPQSPARKSKLFIAQRLDRVELSGAAGWLDPKKEPDRHGEPQG
jgi:hypothetical protein